jgi:organic radical activating enzyme
MISLKYAEFYITNVCNFNCTGCNRLNNYQFAGHQYWEDYAEQYETWSKLVDIKRITILGGEPTLNPTLKDWMENIRKLWPNAHIELLTNGTRLEYIDWLYDVANLNSIGVVINTHSSQRYLELVNYIKNLMVGELEISWQVDQKYWLDAYNNVKDETWPECNEFMDFINLPEHILKECLDVHGISPQPSFKDQNNTKFHLQNDNFFFTPPLKYNGDNTFSTYNSNPKIAHDVCPSKYCHHFVKGKLYKCHHVVLLPEFMQQYKVNITDQDKLLLDEYKPGSLDMNNKELNTFINNIENVISQCKLCPEELVSQQITATNKKDKIIKLTNL